MARKRLISAAPAEREAEAAVAAAATERSRRAEAASPHGALLQMQRDYGNRHVGQILDRVKEAGSAAVPLGIQRKEEGGPAPVAGGPTTVPATATAQPPAATGAVPTTPDAAPKQQMTAITFSAIAEDVPGTGKDRVQSKEGDDAIWFDPLNVHSDTPLVKHSSKALGVLAGSGEQVVSTFPVPVTEGDSPHGSGTVTARLKYANSASKSFDVSVTGTKNVAAATKAARKFLEDQMTTLGDVGDLQREAAADLAKKGFPDATVTIAIKTSQTKDIGETSFFYLARHDPQILMRISAAKVGEKKTTASGSTSVTTDKTTDNESHREGSAESTSVKDAKAQSEKHQDAATETVDVEYNKSVVKTLDDKINKVETARSELVSKLTDVIIDDGERHETETTKSATVKGSYEDFTKTVKGHTEEGDEAKSNWASKGKKVIGVVRDLTAIPIVDKIPVLRKIKSWELDIADAALGLFAEDGTVHYTDSKEETESHDKKGGTDTTTGSKNNDVTSKSTSDRKRELKETFESRSASDWARYKKEIEDTKEKYSSVKKSSSSGSSDKTQDENYKYDNKKDSAGGSDRVTQGEHKSTVATFTTATTWVISKPVVEAAVVAGDGEVSNVPFKEQPPATKPEK